jgi:hypothetical protein
MDLSTWGRLARKGDGEPGVMSIAKGWQRIESGAMMLETMNDQNKKTTTGESCGQYIERKVPKELIYFSKVKVSQSK